MTETEKNLQSLDPIPIDILFEIFLNLPAKSLARFICVSKLWAKTIRNQDFIKAFSFQSSLQNKKQPRLLFAFTNQIKGYQEDWYFFSKSTHVSTPLREPLVIPDWLAARWHDRLARNINNRISPGFFFFFLEEELKDLIVEEPKPLVVEEPPDFESSIVCHLKDLRYQNPSYVHGLISFLYGEEQIICNPSIGKSITLPTVESSKRLIRSFLGYDPINAQYKVLCLSLTNATPFCEHQVLTLGAQNCSWRMIQCNTPHYPGRVSVCTDGVLYYSASISYTVNKPVLVRFALMSECLEIASLFPEGLESSNGTSLINYHGKVTVVSGTMRGDFKLWVLKDAKKQLWSKEQCISTRKFHREIRDDDGVKLLGTSDTGEIIFAPNYFKELVVYFLDLKSNRIRSVELEGNTKYKFRDFYKVFSFLRYVESVMFI